MSDKKKNTKTQLPPGIKDGYPPPPPPRAPGAPQTAPSQQPRRPAEDTHMKEPSKEKAGT